MGYFLATRGRGARQRDIVSRRMNGWLRGKYLELLEFFTLVPASLPSFLHSLDGYESLVGVLWTCTWTALHSGQRCIGG